jgi:hypothetical protein
MKRILTGKIYAAFQQNVFLACGLAVIVMGTYSKITNLIDQYGGTSSYVAGFCRSSFSIRVILNTEQEKLLGQWLKHDILFQKDII